MIDHVRALLITLHLAFLVIAAFPAPRGMKRSHLDDPAIQPAIESWRQVLVGLGADVSAEEFRERLFEAGNGLLIARRTLLKPAQPYFDYCGTRQGWAMFSYLNHEPARLEIHVDRGGGWEPLYVARTSEHDWRRSQFDQERFRALVNPFSWKDYPKKYKALGAWVAGEIAAEDPRVRQVRLLMRRRPLPSPRELRERGELTHGSTFWVTEIDVTKPPGGR